MPISCGTSVLTGQDGSIWFKPAGTTACLLDFTDFPSGAGGIILPNTSDFKSGDKVKFSEEGGNLDSALNETTTYTIGNTVGNKTVILSPTNTPIVMAGDGGLPANGTGPILTLGTVVGGTLYRAGTYTDVPLTGGTGAGARATVVVVGGAVTTVTLSDRGDGYTATDSLSAAVANLGGGTGTGFSVPVATITDIGDDSPGGHINISYADFEAVCNVSSFDLNLTRARIDITSLPCNFSTAAASKFAPFRTYQPGFADGSGTMTVKFSRDQTALSARLLANSVLRVQDGARARLFIDTVVGPTGSIDLVESSYIDVALSIEGMQFSVTTQDSPTEATINFSFQSNPTHLFYTDLV
jgi:hypothetical protein